MIGTIGYVVLMHYRSPVAWFGHKKKCMRLREGQRRLLANRHYPELFPSITWMQMFGLREFIGEVPQFQGRYSFSNESEVAMYLMNGFFWRWKRDWLRYLYPSKYGRPSDIDLRENPKIASWYLDQGHQIYLGSRRNGIVETERETFLCGVLCAACRNDDIHARDRHHQ